MKEHRRRQLLTATIFTFVFMGGFALSTCMLGTLLPGIITHYSLNLTQASALNVVYESANAFAMVVALFVVDRLDKGKLLTLLAATFGLILIFHGCAPTYAVLLGIRLVLGIVGSLLDNLCASYISDLYGSHRARYISILHTLYAIGSMAAPKFAAACYSAGGWSLAYFAAGGAMALAGVLAITVLRIMGYPPTAVEEQGGTLRTVHIPYRDMFRSRNLIWLSVTSILIAGQYYVTIWLSTYLDWLDSTVYTVEFCSTIMTALYLGMILSRIVLAAISEKIGAAVYLKWASLLSSLLLIVLLLVQRPMVWLAGTFLYGLISGAMFTSRIVLSCQEFPQYSASASAFTGVFAALGSVGFNSLMGMTADAGLYTQAMIVNSILVALTFLVFQFGYRSKTS